MADVKDFVNDVVEAAEDAGLETTILEPVVEKATHLGIKCAAAFLGGTVVGAGAVKLYDDHKKYAGMTKEEKKALKAAEKEEKKAAKIQRIEEIRARFDKKDDEPVDENDNFDEDFEEE